MSAAAVLALGVLLLLLLPIVYYDLTQQRIPNLWNGLLAAGGFGYQLLKAPGLPAVIQSLIALVVTAGALAAVIWLMRALKRENGFGMGDAKFLVAASLWVGFIGATFVFVLAAIGAVIWAAAKSPFSGGIDLKKPLAFAPFLAGGLAAMFILINVLS